MFVSPGGVSCRRCGVVPEDGARFCVHCGATLSAASAQGSLADPLIGRRLGSGYVLKELVGLGGMGRVYRAEQDALGRTVAVKVIHPHLLDDERTVARFYREARAASRLNHPNSVSVIDFGRTDDGVLYLVMEHLAGRDLADILAHESMMTLPRICRIVEQVLEALTEAHALGVVHRDLKPENILVIPLRSGADLVKVVDFGLATMLEHEPSRKISQAGSMCGTAEYMSPEQVRGAPVDQRADLYSLGIVLFELLTGSVPFGAESPAKIIFRHLRDQVPDPRDVVPLRNVPEELAQLTLRALEKDPDDRFQSAEEMLEALQRVSSRFGAREGVKCRACDAVNPARTRFCGACGERLPRKTTVDAAPPTNVARMTSYPTAGMEDVLLGRDEELDQLEEARARAIDAPTWVHLTGEPGIGKTRLLTEIAVIASRDGDFVVGATPHPTRAPVPYAPIRHLITRLLEIDDEALTHAEIEVEGFDDPLVRAGIAELTESSGVPLLSRSRIGAVASAMGAAIAHARHRSRTGRVLVLLDDLPDCDALTGRVLAQLRRRCEPGTFIVTAGRPRSAPPSDWCQPMPLMGLDPIASAQLLGGLALPSISSRGRYLLPLYIEQARALGVSNLDDENVPARLADVISVRLLRLAVEPTRVLQAVAVLGDRCPLGWLDQILAPLDYDALDGLVEDGWVRRRRDLVEIAHPFIRDLVLASIPSEARHALHVRALRVVIEHGAPLEVRAEHAFGAGEAVGAMMVLERMGDLALQRGDESAAITAYRRALDSARRELLETGDQLLEVAITTFSRKLGVALERAGDVKGAEGVLREAVDLTPTNGIERGRMLVALAGVELDRERGRLAERLLKQALTIAIERADAELEAQVWEVLARVRGSMSDAPGAVEGLRRACALHARDGSHPHRRLKSMVELARVLVESGSPDEGARLSQEARALADDVGSPALAALALSNLARASLLAGEIQQAESLYREAAALAAEAGDADWHEQWVIAARSASAA